MNRNVRRIAIAVLALVLLVGLSSCRNQTQNRIRRSIQEYTAQRMYITVYAYDGKVLFDGIVDGKVTRSGATSQGEKGGDALGSYVFWYDERGRYHQTDFPYFVTTYERNIPATP